MKTGFGSLHPFRGDDELIDDNQAGKSFNGWCFILAFFLAVMVLGVSPRVGNAAGPWRGQVVDAETGKPLEGVVVLAVWWKYTATPAGWANESFYDSDEVVPSVDGTFVLRSRWLINWVPLLTEIRGPQLYIFKSGYGQWRFQGEEKWGKLDIGQRSARREEAMKGLEEGGIVIELPVLKAEDRLNTIDLGPYGEIPDSRMPRFLEALDRERAIRGRPPLPRHDR
jgi:hypothetical protein